MEEEISAPKGSVLEQLVKQDLSLQGVEELTARIGLLKEEISRRAGQGLLATVVVQSVSE